MSELLLLGVSHKTAPVGLRERLAVAPRRTAEFLRDLRGVAGVEEAAVISTCNRTEVYLVAGDPVEAETAALGMLARKAGIRPTELAASIYARRNCDAARQLYRVSAGLESMIVGEAEVQGQVRRAHEAARDAGTAGPLTNRLFAAALATGKRVRAETEIGARRLSIPSVAVGLARDELGELARRHVVILGAGETSELTARALAAEGVETIFVANRRHDRAIGLARRFGGQVLSFDDLPEELGRADIVLSATGSPHAILGAEELELVMRARAQRPLLLIDIAVPRDVDSACAHVPGVRLYDIDDLQAVVARNRSVRQAEARRAEGIVEQEIGELAAWLGSLEVLPTIADLRSQGSRLVERVLADNAGRWESASPRDRDRVAAIAHALVNRMLHEPTLRLKRGSDDRAHARVQLVRELFALDEPPAEDGRTAEVHELPRRRARGAE